MDSMDCDLEIVRAILRDFGRPEDGYVDTDRLVDAVPSIEGHDPEHVRAHFDRLLEVGILRRTREIQMRYHPDPVTWRPAEAGREWVWRAWSDQHWEEARPILQRLLAGKDPEAASHSAPRSST
jgi:hypothetical protein